VRCRKERRGQAGLDVGFNPEQEEGEDRVVLHIVFGLSF